MDNGRIDMTATEALLSAMWQSPNHCHLLATMDLGRGNGCRHIPVANLQGALAQVPNWVQNGLDCYFACAEFSTPESRKASNAAAARAFWMDIDCSPEKAASGKGYRATADARAAVARFCQGVGLVEPTHLVESGGGLHVYWVLDTSMDAEVWAIHAKQLKELAEAHGLRADPSRTADIASILRLPGTLNHKYDPPRRVVLVQAGPVLNGQRVLEAIRSGHARLVSTAVAAPAPIAKSASLNRQPTDLAVLRSVVGDIDPDIEYPDWLNVLMGIHTETRASEEGLALAIEWSRKGMKFVNEREIEEKWRSFRLDVERPVTMGTLIQLAQASDAFVPVQTEVVEVGANQSSLKEDTRSAPTRQHALAKYSLIGEAEAIGQDMAKQVRILGSVALNGQLTVFYAEPNTGKTLLVLSMLCDAIERNRLNASDVYYLNVDDNGAGLVEKLRIADSHGFNMLAEGYKEFEAKAFRIELEEMVKSGQAAGTVLIFDTLKRFANLMDKGTSASFTKVLRDFAMHGGTVVALAHTNKRRGEGGKVVPGGTSDIRDDFDCAYTLDVVSDADDGARVVKFENIKCRGNVSLSAAYSYSRSPHLTYLQRLRTVEEVDPTELLIVKTAAKKADDAAVIEAIRACIAEGCTSKMAISERVRQQTKASRTTVLAVLEEYAGDDPGRHLWTFSRLGHGKHMYVLLKPPSAAAA